MPSDTHYIARFKQGSESAYHALFRNHFQGQVAAARRRLTPCGLADAEDVALSVFFSLWREVAEGRGLGKRLSDRDSLLRTLALLTKQKIRRARRHDQQAKRDIRRAGHRVDEYSLADPAHAAEWRACFRETWSELIEGLTSLQQVIAELKLAGHSNGEVAKQVSRSERTIERQWSEIRTKWESDLSSDGR